MPPLERIEFDRILGLIPKSKYFTLHAPRQTGKTSVLKAIPDLLNSGAHGPYRWPYLDAEGGQAARNDMACGRGAIFKTLAEGASRTLAGHSAERASGAMPVRSC